MTDPIPTANVDPLSRRVRDVAAVFTTLGFTAFGGPAAHTSLIEDQVVTRRKWLDRQHFLDIVSAINFIPGPNSTELAIHLGYIRAGFLGLVVAGFCFIAPAVLIILPIAWAYVTYGTLPRVAGAMLMVNCAVVAIIAVAAYRFAWPVARQPAQLGVAICSAGLALLLMRWTTWQPELIVLAAAGLFGAARAMWKLVPRPPTAVSTMLPLAALYQFDVGQWPTGGYARGILSLAFFLMKVGATLFGSGYVLVSYLRSGLVVEHGWMTEQQLLDAISIGQFTPGPLLTTATFIGYILGEGKFGGGHMGGVLGAIVATVAIFLPSFVFVAALGPILQRIRHHPVARSALDAMSAAVAALLVIVTVQLGIASVAAAGWRGAIVLLGAAVALAMRLNATWVILAAVFIGMLL